MSNENTKNQENSQQSNDQDESGLYHCRLCDRVVSDRTEHVGDDHEMSEVLELVAPETDADEAFQRITEGSA